MFWQDGQSDLVVAGARPGAMEPVGVPPRHGAPDVGIGEEGEGGGGGGGEQDQQGKGGGDGRGEGGGAGSGQRQQHRAASQQVQLPITVYNVAKNFINRKQTRICIRIVNCRVKCMFGL